MHTPGIGKLKTTGFNVDSISGQDYRKHRLDRRDLSPLIIT